MNNVPRYTIYSDLVSFSWLTEKVQRLPTCFVVPSPPYNQDRIIVIKLGSMLLLLLGKVLVFLWLTVSDRGGCNDSNHSGDIRLVTLVLLAADRC